MTEKQQSAPAETIPEEGLTFENILTEVRVHNCKDRTKLLIDGINDEIKDIMQAVSKYSKDASITLKLEFKCLQANELMVSAKLESKNHAVKAQEQKCIEMSAVSYIWMIQTN